MIPLTTVRFNKLNHVQPCRSLRPRRVHRDAFWYAHRDLQQEYVILSLIEHVHYVCIGVKVSRKANIQSPQFVEMPGGKVGGWV